MKHWGKYEFAKDVSTFNRLIEKFDIPISSYKLQDLDSHFQNDKENLSFIIEDLEFQIKTSISGTVPSGITSFTIYLSHNFILNDEKDFSKEDPFYDDITKFNGKDHRSFSFQINIQGHHRDDDDTYHCWWHLDRHIPDGNNPKFVHPFYHFQVGGNELETKNTGEIVFLAAPRIAYPPMDLFLGIHFVINNFYNRKSYSFVDELLRNDDYVDIIKRAQERMWVPYFNAFKEGSDHRDYTMESIFPLYIN